MAIQHAPGLYIGPSNIHGRGVFVSHDLSEGDIIEICPVIVLEPASIPLIDQTRLYDYYWLWGEEPARAAIVLGYGSIYNHSSKPKAVVAMDEEHEQIVFIARTAIAAGEEVTIDYTGGGDKRVELWFTPVELE